MHVVVINLHGGVPATFIDALLDKWETCRLLRSRGCEVWPRMYTTNACASASLNDALSGASVAGLTDAAWYPWSRTHRTPSLFHAMRERKFRTRLMGVYGLDDALDPRRNLRPHPFDVRHALQHFGVDEYDDEDAAFTCRGSMAHDVEAIERMHRELRAWADAPHFCVLNLLACRDLERLCWRDGAEFDAHVPCVDARRWLTPTPGLHDEERRVGASVLYDDCRSRSEPDDPYRRIGMLYDRLRGERSEPPTPERASRVVSTLQNIAWETLVRLDELLLPIVRALLELDAWVCLGCDHPIGLYEHGTMGGAPWEVCCRGFLVSSAPGAGGRSCTHAAPCSAASTLGRVLLSRNSEAAPFAVTISVSPSNVARAFVEPHTNPFALRVFWARAVVNVACRTYAVVYWWSLDELVARTLRVPAQHGSSARRKATVLSSGGFGEWLRLDETTRAERISERESWRLPLDDEHQLYAMYDLTTDREEMVNLLVTDELSGTQLRHLIIVEARKALEAHGLVGRNVSIRFPKEVHRMSLDYLTTDAVRVRRGMAMDRVAVRSVHVQTDSTVHFARTPEASAVALASPAATPPPPPAVPPPPRKATASVLQLEKGRNLQHR